MEDTIRAASKARAVLRLGAAALAGVEVPCLGQLRSQGRHRAALLSSALENQAEGRRLTLPQCFFDVCENLKV